MMVRALRQVNRSVCSTTRMRQDGIRRRSNVAKDAPLNAPPMTTTS